MVEALTEKEKKNELIQEMMKDLKTKEKKVKKESKKKTKKIRTKNTEKFRKSLKEKDIMNDVRFFRDKMNVDEQELVLKQLEEVRKHTQVAKPYRLALFGFNNSCPI